MSQDDLLPTRRSLLSRLRNWDDQESWQEFFDTYWRLIYSAAIRAGLNEQDVELAFHFTSNTSGSAQGWYLDEVEIGAIPDRVMDSPEGFESGGVWDDWIVEACLSG